MVCWNSTQGTRMRLVLRCAPLSRHMSSLVTYPERTRGSSQNFEKDLENERPLGSTYGNHTVECSYSDAPFPVTRKEARQWTSTRSPAPSAAMCRCPAVRRGRDAGRS